MSNNNQQSITEKNFRLPFILITTLFFLWGGARAILDILNKHFQNEIAISITQSSMIQVVTYLGYFLMAIPAGMFILRYGYRRGLIFGLIFFGSGALLFIPGVLIGAYNMYLFALFIIGCGLASLETAANPYVTELGSKEKATSRLNLAQSFNGLGSIFGAFGVGTFLFSSGRTEHSVAVPYIILGILVFIIAYAFSRVDLPRIEDELSYDERLSSIKNIWKNNYFIIGLVALLAYEVAEISINSYFINFVTSKNWFEDREATYMLTVCLTLFMGGRFIGSAIMRKIDAKKLLAFCAIACVVCQIFILFDTNKLSLIALMATYLFEAIMFPTIFSITIGEVGKYRKAASSVLMMTPIGGCAFLFMGLIADMGNVVLPFIIPLIGFLLVAIYSLIIVCKRKIA